MNLRWPPSYLWALMGLGLLCSCTRNGCSGKDRAAPKDKVIAISEFPLLNFSGLNPEHKTALVKLFNDEICPCGCPKTFAQCLLVEQECRAGQLLGQWAIEQLKLGAPERSLFQVLSEEINTGYIAKQVAINTAGAHQKGDKNAPITIVEFADFECPACKLAARAVTTLMKEKNSEVQLYFMHFPLSNHPQAEAAAVAAEAAGRQGKFWEMHDLLFAHEGALSDSVLNNMAQTIFKDKAKLAQFNKDKQDKALLDKVRGNKEYAMNELKLMGTPSFYFNGRLYNLSLAHDGFLLRLAMERARSSIACQAGSK